MSITGLLLTLFVGLFIFVGSILGVYSKNSKRVTDMSMSMAFGVIVGLIIFELGPETYELLNDELGLVRSILAILILITMGVIILRILDTYLPDHENTNTETNNNQLYHIGMISAVALIIHNLLEGAGLYLVTAGDTTSGLLLCFGIGLHNIPLGLVITTTLLALNKKNTFLIILLLSISSFVGGLIMFIIGGVGPLVKGIMLGITLGMLVYIVIFELFKQINEMENKTLTRMCILFGLSILISSVLISNFIGE